MPLERRAYPRVNVLSDCNGLTLVDVASLSTTGLLVDLSEGGLRVQFATPVPKVPSMDVDFSLGDGRVNLACDVIWSTSTTAGLRLPDLSREARADIRGWLQQFPCPNEEASNTPLISRPSVPATPAAAEPRAVWEDTVDHLLALEEPSDSLNPSGASTVAETLKSPRSEDQQAGNSRELKIHESPPTAGLDTKTIEQSDRANHCAAGGADDQQSLGPDEIAHSKADANSGPSTATSEHSTPHNGNSPVVANEASAETRVGQSPATVALNTPHVEQNNSRPIRQVKPPEPEWAIRMRVRQEEERVQRLQEWRHRSYYDHLIEGATQARSMGPVDRSAESVAVQLQGSVIQERRPERQSRGSHRNWWIALMAAIAAVVVALVGSPLEQQIMTRFAPSGATSSEAQSAAAIDPLDTSTTAVEVFVGKPVLLTGGRSSSSSVIAGGRPVRRELPSYPANPVVTGIKGEVHALLTINSSGIVEEVRIVSGDAAFARTVRTTLKQWRYTPFELNSEAVAVRLPVTVRFRNAPTPNVATPSGVQPSSKQ